MSADHSLMGMSDSWLPNRETVAICATILAAVVTLYFYHRMNQRSFQQRTRHVANEVELVRLCEEIKDEPLSQLDKNIRQISSSDTSEPSLYTFYFKRESVEKSALVSASRYGRVDVVKYFLNNFTKCVKVTQTANLDLPVGRSHSMREVHNCSALYAACFNGSLETATHLMKVKAHLNQKDCLHRTPLQVAAQRGHMLLVQELLSNGADVNACDVHGYTPLLTAVSERNIQVVKVLLEHQADLHHHSNDGYSALHLAAEAGQKQLLELLLEHDPTLAYQRSHDHTHMLACPLYLAASHGHIPTSRLLMDASRCSPAQMPDILLLWGVALVHPQHQYITSSVQRYWLEALEIKKQHPEMGTALPPMEVYEYRTEIIEIEEAMSHFTSQATEQVRPVVANGGINLPRLKPNQTLLLTHESYTEICYQSLLILERCLGYGSSLVIKRLIDVAGYMLSKRQCSRCDKLLCRSLEMSMDRTERLSSCTNYCQSSELEYELKEMMKVLCNFVNDMLQTHYTEMRFHVYLGYAAKVYTAMFSNCRYDCQRFHAKVNLNLLLLLLSLLAAWVYYRNQVFSSGDSSESSENSIDYTEYEECEGLARQLIEQNLFVCNGTTLLHLAISKLGSRDSLLPNYVFLKDLTPLIKALLSWGAEGVVNLANSSGERPLHLAACRVRSEQEACQLITPLLKRGAHIDAVNAVGKTAAEIQRVKPLHTRTPSTLRCLCYNRIVSEGLKYEHLPLCDHFTEDDKALLRLHDPACARKEFAQLSSNG